MVVMCAVAFAGFGGLAAPAGADTSGPALVSWSPNELHVFARGEHCDLLHKYFVKRRMSQGRSRWAAA